MVGCRKSGSSGYVIGWVIVVVCIEISSFRKVTNPSTVLALDGLASEFPWDMS